MHETTVGLPSRPSWLPSPEALRDFYGATSAYPYYRLQVTDYIGRLLPPPDSSGAPLRVIDVGSGDGYLGAVMQTFRPGTHVTGVETQVRALTRPGFEPVVFDGLHLPFADQSFDVATAMYVMTVVPDPAAVMHELARVTKIGGQVVIVNHFSVEGGLRGMIEKNLARFSDVLGWRPEFPIRALMVSDRLKLEELRPLRPMGLFTLLRLRRVF